MDRFIGIGRITHGLHRSNWLQASCRDPDRQTAGTRKEIERR
jgi:hypothetical protein